ncbi:unnamed protein product [Cylindrotheca closterium]|uniref:Coronin n=1 Tax=Cylindrotheca closterium TaxID=2856 RepID=A0AAD2FHI9_9STRA|nr:unnamed protein product [Cylindrotheca closterium]
MTSWGPPKYVYQNLLDLKEAPGAEKEREEDRYPNYCLSWSKHIYEDKKTGKKLQLLACCGGVKAQIVAVERDNPHDPLRPWSTFIDVDPDEKFRASAFGGRSINGSPFLILGGKAAIIKLVDIDKRCLAHTLEGHRGVINDLKVPPSDDSFLLSSAGDEGIRLWNLDVRACVAAFAGTYGHRKAVLSLSWHFEGKMFASSGVDGYVRLWNGVCDVRFTGASHVSRRPIPDESVAKGQPYYDQFPKFASNKLHVSPVDCVHWFKDGRILSKCIDNEFLLWEPDFSIEDESQPQQEVAGHPPAKDVIVFMRFQVSGRRRNYFSRFGVDPLDEQLAVGELLGTISIWNLNDAVDNAPFDDDDDCAFEDDGCLDFRIDPYQTLNLPNHSDKVRVVTYAPNGGNKMLVACSDEGNLFLMENSNMSQIGGTNEIDDSESDKGFVDI